MSRLLGRMLDSIREKGPRRTIQSVLSFIEDRRFEKKFGVDTDLGVDLEDLEMPVEDRSHFTGYQGTRARHFRILMRKLRLPEDCVFVDFGSGKGKVLLLASMHNFKRVIGVEISSPLCRIALRNVELFEERTKKDSRISVVESDALSYEIGDDENVYFFFRPFDNVIMESVIQKIMDSVKTAPRKVWLIFNNFQSRELMAREEALTSVEEFAYGGTTIAVFATR